MWTEPTSAAARHSSTYDASTAFAEAVRSAFSTLGASLSEVDADSAAAIARFHGDQGSHVVRQALPEILAKLLSLDTSSSSTPSPASGASMGPAVSSSMALSSTSAAATTSPFMQPSSKSVPSPSLPILNTAIASIPFKLVALFTRAHSGSSSAGTCTPAGFPGWPPAYTSVTISSSLGFLCGPSIYNSDQPALRRGERFHRH
ncbi:hypothetical protein E2562_019415 [Oryza meyeriana var. granulata]|uniref:Uncharacterized protein n=1 Tax=Oryza meyeriana var. granulata TaxID=110450 RepID=A0A6G1DJ22_9ORYZ|nr:hypothetical protein E2562_019415 [Oryza meyeriana var. granulata]